MKTNLFAVGLTPVCGLALLGTLALPSAHAHASPVTTTPATKLSVVPGKLLLRFKSGTSAQDKKRDLAQVGGTLKHTYSTDWALVQVPQSSPQASINKLKSHPNIAGVQPDYKCKIERPSTDTQISSQLRNSAASSNEAPNDPLYPQQWALERVNAPQAWKTTTGSKDVVIAVMDTGIHLAHEDLSSNLYTNTTELNGKKGVDDDKNGFVDDVHGWNAFLSSGNVEDNDGHGSHVSGIIGAAGNNGKLISGLNWRVSTVSVGVFDSEGSASTDSLLGGIDYILALRKQGVNVRAVNVSLGRMADGFGIATLDGFKALSDAGVLIVCAAGNENFNTDKTGFSPSGFDLPGVLSVGASDYADQRAPFSNYGIQSVDIFAPGRSILSTLNNSSTALATYSGTSMAAPMVTGAAALLWASQPNLTAAQVKNRLLASAKRIEKLRPFVAEGRRLDVGALLDNSIFTIKGKATLFDGKTRQPTGGVSIFLDDHTGTPDALTDSTGRYAIVAVKGGKHTVRAERSGTTFSAPVNVSFSAAKGAFEGMAIANFEANASSKLYALYGRATQKLVGGKSVSKANVLVYLNENSVPFARTDANGEFKIPNLVAGRYVVRMVDAQNGFAFPSMGVVHLPISQPKSDDYPYSPDGYATVDFPLLDLVSPYTESNTIRRGGVYTPQTAPTFFGGAVKDDAGVDVMNSSLYRYLPDLSVFDMYDPVSKEWIDFYTAEEFIFIDSVKGNGKLRVPFKFALPTLDPKYHYEVDAYSYDTAGRVGNDAFLFTLPDTSSPAPKAAANNPSAGSG